MLGKFLEHCKSLGKENIYLLTLKDQTECICNFYIKTNNGFLDMRKHLILDNNDILICNRLIDLVDENMFSLKIVDNEIVCAVDEDYHELLVVYENICEDIIIEIIISNIMTFGKGIQTPIELDIRIVKAALSVKKKNKIIKHDFKKK